MPKPPKSFLSWIGARLDGAASWPFRPFFEVVREVLAHIEGDGLEPRLNALISRARLILRFGSALCESDNPLA
jgi:hypothetical protein